MVPFYSGGYAARKRRTHSAAWRRWSAPVEPDRVTQQLIPRCSSRRTPSVRPCQRGPTVPARANHMWVAETMAAELATFVEAAAERTRV